MDSHKTVATSELQSLLEQRKRIAEGGSRNEAFSPPGRLSSSGPRLPVSRTLNGSHGTVQSSLSSPKPVVTRITTTAVKAFDGRKGHLQTAEERVSSMSQQNNQLYNQVSRMTEQLAQVGGNGAVMSQAQQLLETTALESNHGRQVQHGRDRSRKASDSLQASTHEQDTDIHHLQIGQLQEEVKRLKLENSELKKGTERLETQLEEVRAERDKYREAQQASPAGGSESKLRAVMTSGNATVDELRGAIASVEAVLLEAGRELERKRFRDRRAAFEQLHHALDKADEEMLEQAIEAAKTADVDDEDILKAQNKLLELQMMSPEERATRTARQRQQQQKKDAFQMVKKDDAEGLAALLDNLEEGENWQDWRDYAGRTLVRCAAELRAPNAEELLAKRTKARLAVFGEL
ncbi:Hypothetical protein (Fragment) [Durusdinium trenchii]|uniref:Uncharacterized protein n=1 Tax=Durusdinium trenchii TaxID=1381693 RepID=A0ABP0PN69_9DINO